MSESGESGAPELPGQVLAIFERAGIDGQSVRKEGVKGRPFRMVSRVDVDDLAAAKVAQAAYDALRATQQTLVWNGVNYETEFSTAYIVLSVQSTFKRIAASVGGLSAQAQYLVTAEWELLPVAI
jgi:hypothetical protein